MSSPGSPSTADSSGADRFHEDQTAGIGESPTAIDVDGLELVYSDGTGAVRGIDMAVPEREFFGFLGPNGAGKTTIIKVFAALLSPTSGEVRVNGFDVGSDAPRSDAGIQTTSRT